MKILLIGCHHMSEHAQTLKSMISNVMPEADVILSINPHKPHRTQEADVIIMACCDAQQLVDPDELSVFQEAGGLVVTLLGICYIADIHHKSHQPEGWQEAIHRSLKTVQFYMNRH